MVTPLVLGHRGASAGAPENTVEAFALARRQGADGVELDVRRTRDGAMAVHHDARLPDGRLIVEVDHADLPDTVPTLEAALDACEGMVVNIEIKNVAVDPDFDPSCRLADQVVELLDARGRRDRVIVSCFGLATIDRVKELDDAVPTGFLTFLDPDAVRGLELASRHGHDALHPHVSAVDHDLVARAAELGLAVNVWTVDDPTRIRELAALGVDGIVTNVPDLARAALASGT